MRIRLSPKLSRFVLTGGSSALLNLVVLHALVSMVGLSEGWEQDLANALALEAGILYSFLLFRYWVWAAPAVKRPFWRELATFHGAVAVASIVRMFFFAVLRAAGLPYLLNAAVGIGLVAVLSYFLYERYVFAHR
jgi:Predicted membrane protein